MKKITLIFLVLLFLVGLGLYIAKFEMREPVFEVFFFELTRGRAVFMRTPHGKNILIDGGQNSEALREITKLTPFYKRRIDVLVVTSAPAKNTGGLSDIVKRYEVEKMVEPEIMGTSTAYSALLKAARKKKIFPERVEAGDSFEVDGVKFNILFPDLAFKFNKTSTPEMVLKVDFASTSLLLLGDVSKTIQKRVLKELDKVYLVEFAHGATKSRVSADLLHKLEPEVVVSTKRAKTLRFEFR